MKQKLLIVTQGYPFTRGEASFLEPDLPALTERFDVRIASCYPVPNTEGKAIPDIPAVDVKRGSALKAFMRTLTCLAFWTDVFTALRRGGGIKTLYHRLGFLFYSHLHAAEYADTLLHDVFPTFQPDVAYSFWAREPAYALVLLKKKYPHMRIVTRLHRYDLYDNQADGGMQPFRQALSIHMDALCFISQDGRAYWKSTVPGTAQNKCMLFRLGVPAATARVRPDQTKLVVVSCSRAMPVKRLDRIVKALAKTEHIPIEWHHIGDGETLPEIKRLCAELLLKKECITTVFPGTLPNNEICGYYRDMGARLLINTSESEGLPVSMMEAFAAGLPVLGLDVGGVTEILSPENSILLPADASEDTIAEALVRFYEMPEEEWARMSENAYHTWENLFNANANAHAFSEMLALQQAAFRDTIIGSKSDGKEHKLMGKFVIHEGKTGFTFALKAGNGETILISEVYTTESACKNGIESVKKNAASAVEDQTKEGGEKVKNPKYEVYTDKKDEFRFRLKAGNGEIIGASEGYKAKSSCLNGIESVKKNAPGADVVKE